MQYHPTFLLLLLSLILVSKYLIEKNVFFTSHRDNVVMDPAKVAKEFLLHSMRYLGGLFTTK